VIEPGAGDGAQAGDGGAKGGKMVLELMMELQLRMK
jgi:hypothetical protein